MTAQRPSVNSTPRAQDGSQEEEDWNPLAEKIIGFCQGDAASEDIRDIKAALTSTGMSEIEALRVMFAMRHLDAPAAEDRAPHELQFKALRAGAVPGEHRQRPVTFPPEEAARVAAVTEAAKALERALNAATSETYSFCVSVNKIEIAPIATDEPRVIGYHVSVELNANLKAGRA